jgi:hypothetical protein
MDDYKEALKSGQKAYRQASVNGNYPYLPVLEDIISFADIDCRYKICRTDNVVCK